MKQQIFVTALPNGFVTKPVNASKSTPGSLSQIQPGLASISSSTRCRVSVAFGLQVQQVDTTLAQVPDMLQWPERIRNAKYKLFMDGKEIEAVPVSDPADSELWKMLFRPTLKVKGFQQEDLSKLPIASYPVKHILNHIQSMVKEVGANFSSELPDSDFFIGKPDFLVLSDYRIGKLPTTPRERATMEGLVEDKHLGRRIRDRLNKNGVIAFSPEISRETDFAQLKNFHGIYDFRKGRKFVQVTPPDFEFHDVLSILSGFPQLLRKLGLVVDLEFDLPNPSMQVIGSSSTRKVQVIPYAVEFQQSADFVCTGTAYTRTAHGFYPQSQNGDIQDLGHLKIAKGDHFTVFQIDTDGGALKLCQQADALVLKKNTQLYHLSQGLIVDGAQLSEHGNDAPRKEGLPSNRTAGIAVARNGAAEALRKRFVRMEELKPQLQDSLALPSGLSGSQANWILSKAILFAEDVCLGYRMDVKPQDQSSRWFSLHERINHYACFNPDGSTVPIPDLGSEEGYLQSSLTEEDTDNGKRLKAGEVLARWDGWSLSVPRPGSALNDPKLSKDEIYDKRNAGQAAKENEKYNTPANSDFRLNVRSSVVKGSLPKLRFGQQYAIRLRTVDLAGNSVPLQFDPEQPQDAVIQNLCYQRHEPVDAPFLVLGTTLRDGESSERLVIRSNEEVTVADYEASHLASNQSTPHADKSIRHVKPPRVSVEAATTHSMLDAAFGAESGSKATAIYQKIAQNKDPLVQEEEATHVLQVEEGQDSLSVEYLADPMAAGVSFYLSGEDENCALKNPETFNCRVSFYFDDEVISNAVANRSIDYDTWMDPKTFRVVLREGPTGAVWIPQSRVFEVSLGKGTLVKLHYACFWRPEDLSRIAGGMAMLGLTSLNSTLGKQIVSGRHWLFSPWRTLTLVHATQQPLSRISGKGFPLIQKLIPDRDFEQDFASLNTQILVHGASTAQIDLEASWTEWVDDPAKDNPSLPGLQKPTMSSKVHHFTIPYGVDQHRFGKIVSKDAPPAIRHIFGDTKHRRIDYKAIACTRFREYFFQLIADAEESKQEFLLTRESDVVASVVIPSSARPLAPEIEYVIPTFEWNRQEDGNKRFSARGSGLRVYLRRPWYSSGEGEKLAVVLALNVSDKMSSGGATVTTWGTDPTKMSAPLPGSGVDLSFQEIFQNSSVEGDMGLSTVEHKEARVSVAAYDVKYDQERQLYYADIKLVPVASYFPFVRLALARYQRNSVRKSELDCCLSPIVQADYIQIPPPRLASIETAADNNVLTVALSGNQPLTGDRAFFRRKIEFVVEPVTVASSEEVHFSFEGVEIAKHEHFVSQEETEKVVFSHSHTFTLPENYASQSYRVKVLEYEMIICDPEKPRPDPDPTAIMVPPAPMKDRLVFAEVFEVHNS